MNRSIKTAGAAFALLVCFCLSGMAQQPASDDEEFGPVVRAYLGYLKNEQEVVDDRVSRHEVSPVYYLRNSNRIRALRQMAIRIARESRNDYLPELEAVTQDELGLIFERPPRRPSFRIGEVLKKTFRFLGTVRSNEIFYIFARLDPYEQAELHENESNKSPNPVGQPVAGSTTGQPVRARRSITPR